jgi:hypothetical protein
MPDLTDFQLEVTRLFFSLPASKGFLLAGGAALLAQQPGDTVYGRPGFLHRPGPRPRARGPRRAGSRGTEAGLGHRAHPRQRHILLVPPVSWDGLGRYGSYGPNIFGD